jgi:hypothetical protein
MADEEKEKAEKIAAAKKRVGHPSLCLVTLQEGIVPKAPRALDISF